jgi:uncharacterized protein (DUF4415 family)
MKRNYNFSKGAVIKGKIRSKAQVDEALNQKTLTSIRLDNEVIEIAKKKASEAGIGYLTWINMKLKKAVLEEDELEDRITKLEKAVFKKTGT